MRASASPQQAVSSPPLAQPKTVSTSKNLEFSQLATLQHKANGSPTVQRLASFSTMAAHMAPQIARTIPEKPEMGPSEDPIQAFWGPLIRQFGLGFAQGGAIEKSKDAAIENIDAMIGGAAELMSAAVGQALKDPTIQAELEKLIDASSALNAARDFATLHAGHLVSAIASQIGQYVPELPDWMPTYLKTLQARIAARLKDTYLAKALQTVREAAGVMFGAVIGAGLTSYFGGMIGDYLKLAGGKAVKDTAKTSAENMAKEIAANAQFITGAAAALENVPMSPFNLPRKAGRFAGRKTTRAISGPSPELGDTSAALEQAAESTTSNVTEGIKDQVESGEGSKVGDKIGTALEVARVGYEVGKGVSDYSKSDVTGDKLAIVGKTALTVATPYAATSVSAFLMSTTVLATAPAWLIPVLTAGIVAGSGYLAAKMIEGVSSYAGPVLDRTAQEPWAHPFVKAGQGINTGISAVNLGRAYVTRPVPLIGTGQEGVDEAQKAYTRDSDRLLGRRPAPEKLISFANLAGELAAQKQPTLAEILGLAQHLPDLVEEEDADETPAPTRPSVTETLLRLQGYRGGLIHYPYVPITMGGLQIQALLAPFNVQNETPDTVPSTELDDSALANSRISELD